MKDWSELEDRYQELHATDAKGAEEFKHKMTNRFVEIEFDFYFVKFVANCSVSTNKIESHSSDL